jgi:hypothetical protein
MCLRSSIEVNRVNDTDRGQGDRDYKSIFRTKCFMPTLIVMTLLSFIVPAYFGAGLLSVLLMFGFVAVATLFASAICLMITGW